MGKKRDSFATFLLKSTDSIKELVAIYFGVILLASLAFCYFESMGFFDAVWMAFVTATSTGYGDFFPKTAGGRVVGVFLMHSVLLVVAPMIIYRIIDAIDNNDFTDSEQEAMKRKQQEISDKLDILLAAKTESEYEPQLTT